MTYLFISGLYICCTLRILNRQKLLFLPLVLLENCHQGILSLFKNPWTFPIGKRADRWQYQISFWMAIFCLSDCFQICRQLWTFQIFFGYIFLKLVFQNLKLIDFKLLQPLNWWMMLALISFFETYLTLIMCNLLICFKFVAHFKLFSFEIIK